MLINWKKKKRKRKIEEKSKDKQLKAVPTTKYSLAEKRDINWHEKSFESKSNNYLGLVFISLRVSFS